MCILLQFKNADDAVKAMNQLNGFELAGRPMKVGHVTEKQEGLVNQDRYDNEELERHGEYSSVVVGQRLMVKSFMEVAIGLARISLHLFSLFRI